MLKGDFDVAQICLNGHVINSFVETLPGNNRRFCKECGEATITNCPACDAPIPGSYAGGYVSIDPEKPALDYRAPDFCEECGTAFPWRRAKVEIPKVLDTAALREKIMARFSLEEIKTLCEDCGVDYEGLGQTGKGPLVRELIRELERRNNLTVLLEKVNPK